MGQGHEEKTRSEPKVQIQERGEIFFFYRPKIGKEEAHSPDDVQRLYIVLRPESGDHAIELKQSSDSGKEGEKKHKEAEQHHQHGRSEEVNIEKQPLLRFMVMGRKSLPDPRKKSRPYWGFVEMVTTNIEDIKSALKGEEYDTATRGHRRSSPARALAEGIYRILKHQSGRKTHTHLVYKLEFPPFDKGNEPQESLNVEREGSFLIQIKNLTRRVDRLRRSEVCRASARPCIRRAFRGSLGRTLRFCAADPPDFLNYEGCEFLLISASDDIDEELGLELKGEGDQMEAACSDLIQMFGETASSKPLLSGIWV